MANQPRIRLRPIAVSAEFSVPLIIGRPSAVETLRPGLWRKIQEEFLAVHKSAEGKQCVRFWRLAGFTKADPAFDAVVEKNVADYPITALRRLGNGPSDTN
jgi:hypothetical protein